MKVLMASALLKHWLRHGKSPNGPLTSEQKQVNKWNAEGGEQADNRSVRTIGTLFINGYDGCWRAWTGQLALCVGSRNKKR